MPWQPRAANRARSSYTLRDINFDIDQLMKQVRLGIFQGLDQTGKLAEAYAKKHAPVRKVFHEGRRQGGGVRKGMRTLTDVEVAAEAEDRERLGLGPGKGVRTTGRPGTSPGRPRAPQNFVLDPGRQFGRVGLPNSEAPYSQHFIGRQQVEPGRKAQALDLANYADRQQAILEGIVTPMQTVRSSRRFGASPARPLPPGHPARTYTAPAGPPRLVTNQRQVKQVDFDRGAGGQYISDSEHMDQPKRRIQRKRGQHYIEQTGSLRVREHRDKLPHGAYGSYDPVVTGMTDAMTGRGRYEAGIGVSKGAQHAGRAVILNPKTGRLQVGGRLKHGIKYIAPEPDGTVMTAWVESPTYYTRYVEFGTRHAHAQPFLRPAVGHVREQMRDNIRKAIARRVRRR